MTTMRMHLQAIPITDNSGKLLDFESTDREPVITDFSRINREIIVEDGNCIKLGGPKTKNIVKTIDELEKALITLIAKVYIANPNIADSRFERNPRGEGMLYVDFEHGKTIYLLAYQIMFDILYEKYVNDLPLLTLNKYCECYIDFNWDNSICNNALKEMGLHDTGNMEFIAILNMYIELLKLELAKAKYVVIKGKKTRIDVNLLGKDLKGLTKKTEAEIELYFEKKMREFESLPYDINKINPKKLAKALSDIDKIMNMKRAEAISAFSKNEINSKKLLDAINTEKGILEDKLKSFLEKALDQLVKAKNRATKAMRAQIKRDVAIKKNLKMQEDHRRLGINPAKYIEYHAVLNDPFKEEKQKSKCLWDYVYYNCNFISARQYSRSFGIDRKNRNYYYQEFIDDYNFYDRFVEALMPIDENMNDDYFRKSMEFYHLERYKRLDFIYKLAVRMESEGMVSIDREDARVRRFAPRVFWPRIDDESSGLCYGEKNKWYLPLLFIEEQWLEQKKYDDPAFFDVWYNQNLIRAKVYERFSYHFEFVSEDYEDISNFIRSHYNILSYHEKEKKWLNSEKNPREQTIRIQNAEKINLTLFWDSDKRIPVKED